MITKHYRRLSFNNSSSGADGKVRVEIAFDQGSNPRFAELFSLPFQIRYHVGSNLKVELKVSDRVKVGVGRNLLSQ